MCTRARKVACVAEVIESGRITDWESRKDVQIYYYYHEFKLF